MRRQISELNAALRIDAGDIDLPAYRHPARRDLNGHQPAAPLIDSRWTFAEQCERLIASKAYDEGELPHPDAA